VDVNAQNCTVCLNVINALRTSTVPDQTIAIQCPDEECAVFFLSQLDNLIVAIHRDNEDRDICKMLNFCSDVDESKRTGPFIESKLKCAVCVASLSQIWERLSIDATSRDVVSILNEICPKYPASEEFCRSLQMKGSVSRILGGLLDNKTPKMTCTDLNLCTPESFKPQPSSIINIVSPGSSKFKCSACQGFYYLAKTYKDTDSDISQSELSSLCKSVPSNLRDSCNELLQYGSLFHLAITSGSDAITACKTVNYCTPEDLRVGSSSMAGGIPPLECQACQWAVSAVESYLSQDPNVNDLAYVLEALCTVLPPPYTDICKNFVDLYLDEALLILLDTLTPPVVCTKLLSSC